MASNAALYASTASPDMNDYGFSPATSLSSAFTTADEDSPSTNLAPKALEADTAALAYPTNALDPQLLSNDQDMSTNPPFANQHSALVQQLSLDDPCMANMHCNPQNTLDFSQSLDCYSKLGAQPEHGLAHFHEPRDNFPRTTDEDMAGDEPDAPHISPETSTTKPHQRKKGSNPQVQRKKNRIAATKCRRKQKQHVQALQERESELESEHANLTSQVAVLKSEVLDLKDIILSHANCDSDAIQSYIHKAAKSLA